MGHPKRHNGSQGVQISSRRASVEKAPPLVDSSIRRRRQQWRCLDHQCDAETSWRVRRNSDVEAGSVRGDLLEPRSARLGRRTPSDLGKHCFEAYTASPSETAGGRAVTAHRRPKPTWLGSKRSPHGGRGGGRSTASCPDYCAGAADVGRPKASVRFRPLTGGAGIRAELVRGCWRVRACARYPAIAESTSRVIAGALCGWAVD
jgi:hypothetical protein